MNVSAHGYLFTCRHEFQVGERLFIELFFPRAREADLRITAMARVVRVEPGRVAVEVFSYRAERPATIH